MTFNIEAVKKHRTAILVGVGVLAAYILYRIFKSQGNSGGLAGADGQTPAQQQIDLINAQAAAQSSVIAASYAGQVQVAQVGAGTYTQYLQTQSDINLQNDTAKQTVAQAEIGVYQAAQNSQNQINRYTEQLASQAMGKWKAPTSNDIALLISAIQSKGPQQSYAFAADNASNAGSSPAAVIGALNPAGLFGAYEAVH